VRDLVVQDSSFAIFMHSEFSSAKCAVTESPAADQRCKQLK